MAANVEPGAIVHTDGWGGYAGLAALGFDHQPIAQRWRNRGAPGDPPARSSRPRQPQDLASGHPPRASAKHLQVYLDEFVFRHNRRRTPMAAFQTLLGLSAIHEPTTYREITDAAA